VPQLFCEVEGVLAFSVIQTTLLIEILCFDNTFSFSMEIIGKIGKGWLLLEDEIFTGCKGGDI
jgi:hypothetical protein